MSHGPIVPIYPTIHLAGKGHRYNPQTAAKAKGKFKFIYVSSTGKKGEHSLSGADAWLIKHPGDIYSWDYAICGNPNDVSAALRGAGYNEGEVGKAIANAFTYNNIQPGGAKVADFERLLAEYDEIHLAEKAEAKSGTGGVFRTISKKTYVSENGITAFHYAFADAKGAVITGTGQPRALGSRSRVSSSNLSEAIMNMSDPVKRAFNVDGFSNNPKSYKSVTRPKTNKGRNYAFPGAPFVSSNLSDYTAAVNATDPTKYAGALAEAQRFFGVSNMQANQAPAGQIPAPGTPSNLAPDVTFVPNIPAFRPAVGGVPTKLAPFLGGRRGA